MAHFNLGALYIRTHEKSIKASSKQEINHRDKNVLTDLLYYQNQGIGYVRFVKNPYYKFHCCTGSTILNFTVYIMPWHS